MSSVRANTGSTIRHGLRVATGLSVLGTACEQPSVDEQWFEARAACEVQPDALYPATVIIPETDGVLHQLTLPDGCANILLDVVHADAEQLLRQEGAHDSLDEHVERVRLGQTAVDGVAELVWGLAWIVGSDFGSLDEVQAGPFSDADWVEDHA